MGKISIKSILCVAITGWTMPLMADCACETVETIQLYDVSLRNDTQMPLVVTDMIVSPDTTEQKIFTLQPGQSKFFSWNVTTAGSTFTPPRATVTRRITIVGACQGVTGKTNTLIVGNVPDRTFIQGGLTPGGLYVISQTGPCAIIIGPDTPQKTNPVFFSRGLQVWDVVIENGTNMPLQVLDEIFGPQGVYASKSFIIPRNAPQLSIRWDQNFSNVVGRRIIIQGDCQGATGKTNKVVIGNVNDPANPVTDPVPAGMPGGNYRIAAKGCTIYRVTTVP